MALQILCVFLIALSSGYLVESRSYNTGLIFYDLATKQTFLPPTVSVSRGRGLANFKFSDKGSIWSTFGKPCDCSGPLCGCCVGIKVKQYNFDQKMCANVSYVKPKEEINLEVYLNETQSAKYGVSARNPSPFCIPVMMGIPMSMCVQMSNVGLQGNNLNMCMDFIVRMASTQLFEMHFQCMKMGAQGVQWVGPEGSPVIPPGESKLKDDSDNDSLEYYDEEEVVDKNAIDVVDKGEEAEEDNNALSTEDKEEEENEENNEIDTGDKEGEQAVEEFENKAEEVMDDNELKDRDHGVQTEIQASEGEQTKENDVDLSDEENNKVVDKEVLKDIIGVPENSTIVESSVVSRFDMLTNVKATPTDFNTNESDSNELLIAPLEVVTQQQLDKNEIMPNLKPTMATTTATILAIENNDIDNIDNAATIATIMSSITSTMASTTSEAQGISATPKTSEATTTVAAASTSTDDGENNDSDNSQDNDSDYEHEDEESDENEEDEGAQEEDEESEKKENKNVLNESESQKEQLENVNNVNTTVADNHTNLNANNGDKGNEIDEGGEVQETDEEDDDEDDEDEDEDDEEDETEEDSDEIANKSTGIDNTQHQNISFTDNTTTAVRAIPMTSSSTTNAIAEKTDKNNKPDEHLININSNHLQLAMETIVNTLDISDSTNSTIINDSNISTSSITTSNNNITHNTSNNAADDSTPPPAGGNNSNDNTNMSQITGTVTPLTSARKLLALQRQSHPPRQRQQKQRLRQRHQQQQQHTKWQYPLHQQVQHQHRNHNHIQYQLHSPRQQRNHRLHYGA